MGFINGLFSGDKGANFQAQSAGLQQPSTAAQANTAYDQTQNAIQQQLAFLQALQGQNGIANQSSVFNQQQGVANGTGPNPAQAMLANATGANVANQAALQAGQRGAGANVGLMARQAAQQGANTQQQAVGQGASLQAQQSLNALNNLGGIAQQQVGNLAGANQNYNAATQGQQANILGGIQGQNAANVSSIANQNQANAGIAQGNQAFQSGLTGGAIAGAAKGASMPFMADGGEVPAEAPMQVAGPQSAIGRFLAGAGDNMSSSAPQGNPSNPYISQNYQAGFGAGQALAPKMPAPQQAMQGMGKPTEAGGATEGAAASGGAEGLMGQLAPAAMMFAAQGGKVPALVSPGEVYVPPSKVNQAAKGNPMQAGEKIPGKPKVPGAVNSYANDTVPKTLESGGIVIPRAITQGPNAEAKANAFVRAILAKQNMKKGK